MPCGIYWGQLKCYSNFTKIVTFTAAALTANNIPFLMSWRPFACFYGDQFSNIKSKYISSFYWCVYLPTGLCSVLSFVLIKFKCVDSCALYMNILGITPIQIDERKYLNTTTEEHSRSLVHITRYCRSRILKFDSCTWEWWCIWGC